MAYRNSYNYKGGSRRVRETRKAKGIFRIICWCLVWLLVGMLIAHLIFSIAGKVRRGRAELSSEGIPPVVSIQDAANSESFAIYSYDGNLADHAATDRFIAFLREKGIDRVLLDIKPESGLLAYSSGLAEAKRYGAVPEGAPSAEDVMVKFSNAGIRVSARISLYIDDAYAAANPQKAARISAQTAAFDAMGNPLTTTTDTLWLDRYGRAWADPFDEGVVRYAENLIFELSAFGFEGVVVENIRFPTACDGNAGSVAFPSEKEDGLPRAGVIRSNSERLYSAAVGAGVKLYTVIDSVYACGVQDETAGITFNVFELSTDAICPVFMPSRIAADGVEVFGATPFEDAENADIAALYAAMLGEISVMQGAVAEPPALCPLVQAYTDTSVPASGRRTWTADDLSAELAALDAAAVRGRIIVGTWDEYKHILG